MRHPKDRENPSSIAEQTAKASGSGSTSSSAATQVSKKKGIAANAPKLRVNRLAPQEPVSAESWEIIPLNRPKFCVPAMPKVAPANRIEGKNTETVHLGRIFEACYEKGPELPAGDLRRKFKGRTGFQGIELVIKIQIMLCLQSSVLARHGWELQKLFDAFASIWIFKHSGRCHSSLHPGPLRWGAHRALASEKPLARALE